MIALVVTVTADDAEVASDALWSIGVTAIEERATTGSDRVELWTSLGDDVDAVTAAVTAAFDGLGHPWQHRFETVDESVADNWRAFAEPTWVDRDLVISPAWIEAPTTSDEVVSISIDPGATFGMGDHPTTILSMLALRRVTQPGSRVLDVGCGSGVLAIAACRFGALLADGIDISLAAVPTTIANAERNGVADRVRVSTTPLAEVDATYDVVVANILAPALIALADDLERVLSPNGTLIISGILSDHHTHVLDALRPLVPVDRRDRDGWTAVSLTR